MILLVSPKIHHLLKEFPKNILSLILNTIVYPIVGFKERIIFEYNFQLLPEFLY